jgi:tRNA dimethylallyltransferase
MACPMMVIGLTMARDALYRRLDARVDRMLASGFAAEVEGLLAAGLSPDLPAMQGIGYRHLAAALIRGGSLEDAARAMKRDTRRYAKRQLTWFAREEGVRWLIVDPGGGGAAVEDVKKLLEQTRAFA